ncbi:MAG TPA: copper transporter [Aeromicrobium sp.]|nr:copper transporter [Aeromicrobium sp.]HKY56696.1 copper transporter [Aeromicrobium sp.]
MKARRRRLLTAATMVFALALGIALGAGPLGKPANVLPGVDEQRGQDPSLAAFEADFVKETSGEMLAGRLRGRNVVLVTVAGARTHEVARIKDALEDADATIVSEPTFTAKLIDPANRQFVDSVARSAALKVREIAKGPGSYQRIGTALARAFLNEAGTEPDEVAGLIWEAFTEGDLITGPEPEELGDAVVMVVGGQRAASQSKVIGELVRAIGSHAEGTVLAGPAAASRSKGAVAALREGPAAEIISSVDVTDSVAGPVVVALALQQDQAGEPGAWGTPRSADGPLPEDQ